MPTYDYYCKSCDRDIEVFQSITAEPLKVCPECNKKGKITRKIGGGAGIIFKGSGFYETDYKSKGSKSSSEKSSASGETKKSETPSKSKSDKTKSKD